MKSLPPNRSEARPVRSGATLLTAALVSGCAGMQTLDQQRGLWSQAQASLKGSPQARIEACAGAPMGRRTDGSTTTVQYGVTQQFSGASSWCVVDVSFQNGVVSGFSSRSANPGGLTDGSPTCGLIFDACYGSGTAVQDAYSFAGTVSVTRMRGEAGQEIASAQRAGQNATSEAIRSFLAGPLAGGVPRTAQTTGAAPSQIPPARPPGAGRGPVMAPMFPVPPSSAGADSGGASARVEDSRPGAASTAVAAGPASRESAAGSVSSPTGSSARPQASRGADGCEPSLAFIEPRLPICRDHSQLLEFKQIAMRSYDDIASLRAQGSSYEEIARALSAQARQYDDAMKQTEQSMLEVVADSTRAKARLAALRATPPRCDASEQVSGMGEAAYESYVVSLMAAITNRALAAVAACRARAGL